jgi:hypothetical protein
MKNEKTKERTLVFLSVPPLVAALLLAGCTSPIGADRVGTRQAYEQVSANAFHGEPSADTVSLLHRYDLDGLAASHADEAVRRLHQIAVTTGDRDLLFALAEVSYEAGDQIRRSVKRPDNRDSRDFYLGSAVYAWLFLFGEGKDEPPDAFDRRFREACDFYNYGLGLALTGPKSTNAVVLLDQGRRKLPVGEIEVRLSTNQVTAHLGQVEELLLADQFRVRGLSVRNRKAGVGVPLIAVRAKDPVLGTRIAGPGTVLLRVEGSLADLGAGRSTGALELFSPFDKSATVTIGRKQVPLEFDLTAYRAWTLNQASMWSLGSLQFLAPAERIPSRLLLSQPYDPSLIPVVYVHGTFSSPVTWAEMANTLTADPVLNRRYQIWFFMYGSGNPIVKSISELRGALTAEVQKLDPEGTNAMLHQMVVIGHSQGGLLTKSTVVSSVDKIWRLFNTNRLEDLHMDEAKRAKIRQMLFVEPLPFVKRVIFIATPHRGSYLSGGFARRWAARLVSLPRAMVSRGQEVLSLSAGSQAGRFFKGRIPTSLDGMSPENPALLAMAELPVSPPIKAHSIIAVQGNGDYHQGKDGIVAYQSAHLDGVESEFIVRSFHTCLDQPATIEEVRRILREHLSELPGVTNQTAASSSDPKNTNPP